MTRIFALMAALALAACSGTAGISVLDRGGYTPDQYELAVADGPARAIVRNNPFAGDVDDAGTIAAFMGHANPRLALAKTPPATRRYDYRIVVQFGEPAYMPGIAGGFIATCEDGAQARALPAEGPWPFRVAFCNGQRTISEARGFFPRTGSPGDVEFRSAAGYVMTALTNPNAPNLLGHSNLGGWPNR